MLPRCLSWRLEDEKKGECMRLKVKDGVYWGAALLLVVSCQTLTAKQASHDGSNLINVSWGDQIVDATGVMQLDTEEKIERCIAGWGRQYEAGAVLWRGAGRRLDMREWRARQRVAQ